MSFPHLASPVIKVHPDGGFRCMHDTQYKMTLTYSSGLLLKYNTTY